MKERAKRRPAKGIASCCARAAGSRHVYTRREERRLIPYLQFGPITIGTFGLMMAVAFLTAFFVLRADFRRHGLGLDPETVVAVTAIAGMVGAKLYHALERPAELAADPAGVLFDRAGFAWFGGLVLALAAMYVLARRAGIHFFAFLDACAPAAAIGYAVGRIGCLLSGDGDYGRPTDLPWGMAFPNGLVPTFERVHPTPIYEALFGVALFAYLWRKGRDPQPLGQLAGEYLIWSGVARFLVEFIRINPRTVLGMFSNAQAMSVLSVAAGILILYLGRRMTATVPKKRPRPVRARA